ncbi:MAG TPA: SO_0444 family Cu/Zn efflux transporter [Thermoanaerobaculia bacterium]|nr:SO_0444 family Cu/Zn efflux transporter [Thermoanaerobaculia bacterium]
MNLLYRVFEETYRIVLDSGFFILLGFVLAGLLHEFVDTARIGQALGDRSLKAILKAAFVGGPLPLCSCGVLPMAVALRKKGASREATVSFLISTPETGEEAILITWGLLGPVMAIARPVIAIVTAIVAGLVSLVAGGKDDGAGRAETLPEAGLPVTCESPGTADGCSSCPEDGDGAVPKAPSRGGSFRERSSRVLRYAFITMVDELVFWMLLAFVATGLLGALLPPDFFLRFLPSPLLSMVLMALVGIPMYVCASASTPVAAAMMAKGLDPGSALVFMLTGPATNASTIAVVARLFGRRFVAIYLGSIFGVAIASGLVLNAVIGAGIVPAPVLPEAASRGIWALVKFLSAFAFLALMAFSIQRRGLRAGWNELKEHARAFRDLVRREGPKRFPRRSLAIAVASAVGLLWARSAFLVVRPGETGLVRTLGKVTSADLGPGLHLVPPFPFGEAEAVPTSLLRSVDVGFRYRVAGGAASAPLTSRVFVPAQSSRLPEEAQFLTGDENVIEVAAVVHYRVADPALYRFGVDRAEPAFRDLARAFLVEEVGRTPIDAIYTSERGGVERKVLEALQQSPALRETGLAPVDLRLLFVHAPDDVHGAFRDIASAAEDRTTAQNKALVEAEGALGQARGEVARTLAEADSERTRLVDTAQGDAAAFVPLAREVAAAPQTSRMRLKLEALERVLPGVPKLIRPDARRAPGFELWITPESFAGSPGAAAGSAPLPGLSGFVNPIPTPSPDIPAAER